jgi:uncharacterized protein (DUF305 family)
MKIELKKRDGIYFSIIGVLILIVLRFFAFDSGNHMNDRFDDRGRDQMGMGQNNSSNLSGNEYMFAEMMIPHHQQAIEMSDLAIKISKNSELINLAKRIKAEQTPEITQMRNWLTAANASETMDHSMGMGGMLSDSEISTLSKSTGKTFDSLFLKGMIAHHEGAIHMVMMIEDSSNTEVRALGDAIVKSQSAEIFLMKDLLKTL